MRSLVTFEVDHNESTDPLTYLIAHVLHEYDSSMRDSYPNRAVVVDYNVKVDVSPMDSLSPYGACQCHTDFHHFSDECVGFHTI